MTEHADLTGCSDGDLLDRVRAGDNDAFGTLYDRHQGAAHRLARQLARGSDTDDLVAEAFLKVLQRLRGGAGPDVAFRAYLLTAVRRLHVDRVRATQRVRPSDDPADLDAGVPFQDTAVDGFERSATVHAFTSLPRRWREVLWHLEVEGRQPSQVAPLLGVSANGVSALAYRAREGLRQAYLQMHLADAPDDDCRWTTERLGGYVRRGLAARDTTRVRRHLEGCARCTTVYLELVEINSNLRGLLVPLLLAGMTGSTVGGTAAAASRLPTWAARLRDALQGWAQGVGQAAAQASTHTAVAAGLTGTVAAGALTAVAVAGPGGAAAPDGSGDPAVRTASAGETRSPGWSAPKSVTGTEPAPSVQPARPAAAGDGMGVDLSVRDRGDTLAGTVRLSGRRPAGDLRVRLVLPGHRGLAYDAAAWDCSRDRTDPKALTCLASGRDPAAIEFDLTDTDRERRVVSVTVSHGGRVLDRADWSAHR